PAPGPLRAPDAEPACPQPPPPGPRRPALHQRFRADVGRRAGIGDWGFGIRRRATALVHRGPTRPPTPPSASLPRFPESRIPNPHSRLPDMNRKGDKALIVGLDIGTSKVVALVGEYSPGNPIEVIGIGSHESRGLKRGVVVDIESTVQSIQRAVEEAELMAGCEIRSVYASISGNHVQCRNSPGIVPIRDGEVTYADLDRVLEAAKAVAIPADQRILHAIPRE